MFTYTVKFTPLALHYLDYIRTDNPTPGMMRICLSRREDELPYTKVSAKTVAEGLRELRDLARRQSSDRSFEPDVRNWVRGAANCFGTLADEVERSVRPKSFD
jgi:hypothetical protein